ncbi:hypothetical protein PV726_43070 [Streptomyces europaeiscabiei]|uniref:hypothetical protein n=1 Tax=Streptomyces europaeiscabiei TaxID=146819 RepID=UPI0029A44834|nr:hypothetical protein [Streptomyces europaeiscabiei]MDX3696913.1 hypothetical protein [Streptomyces europaeiscabiei]
MNPETPLVVPGRRAGDRTEFVAATPDGIRLESLDGVRRRYGGIEALLNLPVPALSEDPPPDLVTALIIRSAVYGRRSAVKGRPLAPAERDIAVDHVAAGVLVLPRSERWREAVSTALVGDWCDPLWQSGQLPVTALGALKAEARAVHRHLVPAWRRRTRHGRVLSLDADLGGLSLHDLVAADIDLLARAAGGVFEDERLNTVLRGLAPDERQVVFAYAEGEGSTWTEAAAFVGAAEPDAFGDRVRRKAKRLAAEQRRRLTQCSIGTPQVTSDKSFPIEVSGR